MRPLITAALPQWSSQECGSGRPAENFALLRRMVDNLLQHERSVERGVKFKRLKAALDENYLPEVLRL